MEESIFNLRPENFQPSGIADFSKIYNPNPKNPIVTYTCVNTGEKEKHYVETTELITKEGDKKLIYNLPPPFEDFKGKN
jgi:hypothetical protein